MSVRVTGVIPCHNHEQWVCDAVRSMAFQDYPLARIVVVNDGSTDDSVKNILAMLVDLGCVARKDDDSPTVYWGTLNGLHVFVYCYSKAAGPAVARNRGIEAGWDETDLYAFCDSDDCYEQGKVRRSVEEWLKAPTHIGVVYSDYDTLRPDGLRLRQFKEPFSRQRLLQECIVNCDSIISKNCFEVTGLFDPEMRVCEDFDFWQRACTQMLICHIPESLVSIRVGQHSSTDSVPSEVWKRCYARVFEKVRQAT